MTLTVIVCTRNPRPQHWGRTLAALRAQTFAKTDWELVVVDNASSAPINADVVAWHPSGRVIVEPTPGLMSARLRGIAEATGQLLVFVDDDNLLRPNFLAVAQRLALREPALGAFGGNISGEFETPPSAWFAARLDRLAIRHQNTLQRCSEPDPARAPCGAGLCVRTIVAREFASRVASNPRFRQLGWGSGQSASGDDTALSLTACDLGLQMGHCPELQLIHLIPSDRLTWHSFARLTCSHARGRLALFALRGETSAQRRAVWAARRALWKWTVLLALIAMFTRPAVAEKTSS